jgi:hypothetical protein
MAQTLLYKGVSANPENGARVRLGHVTHILADNLEITPQDAQFMKLDGGGSVRDIIMPAVEVSQGSWFHLANIGGEVLTVKNQGDDTLGTLSATGAPPPSTAAKFAVCDGATWSLMI